MSLYDWNEEQTPLKTRGETYGGVTKNRLRNTSIDAFGPDMCTLTWENINVWKPDAEVQGCSSCCKKSASTDIAGGEQILHGGNPDKSIRLKPYVDV